MKLPKAFQTRIVERFYKGKALASFVQDYNEAKFRVGRTREVNDKDLLILADWKKGMLPNELVTKHKMSKNRIETSLRIAALSKLA